MICPDGSRYEGGFVNGESNGQGVRTYPVGQRSEGEWKSNKAVGKGIWTTLDGSPIALDEEGGIINAVIDYLHVRAVYCDLIPP